MFVTKRALSRRTFLRGLGTTVSLPLLDAMVPALSAQSRSAAAHTMRLAAFYAPNGVYLPNFHPAGNGGTAFALPPVLLPLASAQIREVM